ncbi:MAG TPA: class II fructose-bisphosphate aldolase [Candidatus Acetothermia bacterium]|nr:class II fructose-bisphosphate aldolase [Candidatus Bipolaricaulota bacterium]HDJ29473.1 class II fructose-bisphosphate aldolase [Candidatus Acetothermia bacterium]
MPFFRGEKLREVYKRAQAGGYAYMANNIAEENVLLGLLAGYKERNSDLVVQVSPGAAKFAGGGDKLAGLRVLSYMIRTLAEDYPIGVFLNLDHFTVNEMEIIKVAIDEGLVSSIMIDASKESFEENVRISHEVVEMAKGKDVLIEAELGKIKGVEDEIASAEAFYTDPDEAAEFIERTGADLLAISVGTQHGVSKGKDVVLRTDIAKKIRDRLEEKGLLVPLVLHGSSGLLPEQVREIIRYGVCKLNKDTRYQYEYARTAHDFYMEHSAAIVPPPGVPDQRTGLFSGSDWTPDKKVFDPRVVGREIQARIKEVAIELIDQAGSAGHTITGG